MNTTFDSSVVARATAQVVADLPALEWITDARVDRLSQDF